MESVCKIVVMIAAMLGDGSPEMRRGADGEEFLGFISGEFSFYGSYTDLIMRQRGE